MTFRWLRRALVIAVIATAVTAPLAFADGLGADLAASKSGPAESPANSDVSYGVTVSNFGPDDALTVTLTDLLPGTMTFVSEAQNSGPVFSCSTPSVGSGGTITCTIATLPAGTSADFTFVFHIPGATPPGTTFTNIASVTSGTFDPNSENDSGVAVTSTPPPAQADMAVSKSGPAFAGPDTNVAFTLTLTNNGPAAASGVTLLDPLPGTMTFVSLVQGGGPVMSCTTPGVGSGGTVTCTAASFAAGATATFTLTGHVPPGTAPGTFFTNTATVSAATADPTGENDAATAAFTIPSVDVSVTKSGPGIATAGTDVTYTLTLSNAGPDDASNTTLSDPLPSNTTFVSLVQNTGPAASCVTPTVGTNGTVSCNVATLANGASAQFTLVIQAGNTTSITNTVSAVTAGFDTNSANNTASATTTVTPRADVGVTKSGPATVTAGSNAAYTVTVTNNGPSDAANVALTDAVAAPLTFVSLTQTSGPPFGCTTPAVGATGTITCNLATLPAGASATFAIVLQVASSAATGASVSNTSNIATTTTDPNPANNTSTATATVSVSADVSVTKSGPASAAGGSNVTYTVTVTNNGPSDAANVALTDTLPPATTFVSLTQTSGPAFACTTPAAGATGTITCSIATLASGGSATFALVVALPSVGGPASNSVSNTATVASATSDPNPANNSSTAVITLATAVPALSPLAFALLGVALAVVGFFALRVRSPWGSR